jgi:hypothetical protein
MLEKIENTLIGISRYFLIILGALSLVGAVLVLLYSLSLITDSPNSTSEKIEQINYLQFKKSIFPKKVATQQSSSFKASKSASTNQDIKEETIVINPMFRQLKEAMSNQFNDSQEMIDSFSNNITARSLQEFISKQYFIFNNKTDEVNSLKSLVIFFDDMKDLSDLKKIGDFDARLEIVSKLVDLYFKDYYEEIDNREYRKQASINTSSANNILGYSYLQYVLYALAVYALAVLYLMIFKVEIDLRRIPTAINEENDS